MAVRYVTTDEVRVICGIDSTLISDADLTEIVQDVEFQAERHLNVNFSATKEIDILDGNGKEVIFTRKSPLLTVRSLESNDTSLDIENITFSRTGKISLKRGSATVGTFTALTESVVIEYIHGMLEWDKSTETTSTAAVEVGTSVAIAVSDGTGFSTGDWVEIRGTDKNWEVAKITGATSSQITVDQLIKDHASGSYVRKFDLPNVYKRLVKILAGLAAVARVVGESSTDIVGYTMGEFQVQKGEPYTQWRETANQLIRERDNILGMLRSQPGIVI